MYRLKLQKNSQMLTNIKFPKTGLQLYKKYHLYTRSTYILQYLKKLYLGPKKITKYLFFLRLN